MAAVGQVLKTPEAGWRRIDAPDDRYFIANQFIVLNDATNLYGGSSYYAGVSGGGYTCKFRFKGTKLRLIGYSDTRYPSNNSITIDGVSQTFTVQYNTGYYTCYFEITGLAYTDHNVLIQVGTNGGYNCIYIDAIDIDEVGEMLSPIVVGDVLTAPQAGWRRIDDADANITHNTSSVGDSAGYLGSYHHLKNVGDFAKFNFTGKKIRLIAVTGDSTNNNPYIGGPFDVIIDGQTYVVSNYASLKWQVVVFHKDDLENKEHTVVIRNTGGTYIWFDAVDIDATAEIRPYNPLAGKYKTSLSAVSTPGDYVWCKYAASAGAVGTFSDLAVKTDAEVTTLPTVPTTNPSGYFRFIFVGYDHIGNKKFVADRIIQYGLDMSVLTTAGLASGSGLPIKIGNDDCIIRMLTTGIDGYNTTSWDTHNEYDKILANCTLGNLILPGDTNIWNPYVSWEWGSTMYAGCAEYYKVRGNLIYGNASSNSYAAGSGCYGFRPVLIIEKKINITFVEANPTHMYTNNTSTQITAKASSTTPMGNITFKVVTNGIEIIPYGAFSANTVMTAVIPLTALKEGNNVVEFNVKDENGLEGTDYINIIREVKHRTAVERTFNDLDGGYERTNILLSNGMALPKPSTDLTLIDNGMLGSGRVFSLKLNKFITRIEVK